MILWFGFFFPFLIKIVFVSIVSFCAALGSFCASLTTLSPVLQPLVILDQASLEDLSPRPNAHRTILAFYRICRKWRRYRRVGGV